MKRHPSLEPFSRDHNTGLIVARRLTLDGMAAVPAFRDAWEQELRDHFDEEERLLIPLCPAATAERLISEHNAIRSLGTSASQDSEAQRLGELLHDHIRWEERDFFVAIEETANEASLRSLGQATSILEKRRKGARRAELVAKRPGQPVNPALADLGYLATVSRDHGPQWGLETEDLDATLLTWSEGQGIQEHVNDEVDVLIVVLSGEIEVVIDGAAIALKEGQTIAVPKGAARSLMTTSGRAAHLNVHSRKRKMVPTLKPFDRDRRL